MIKIYLHTLVFTKVTYVIVVEYMQAFLSRDKNVIFFWLKKVFANMWFDHVVLGSGIGGTLIKGSIFETYIDTFIFIYVCLIYMNLDIYQIPNKMEGMSWNFNALNTKT